MRVKIVPFARDNYAYILKSPSHVIVIDPGEAEPVRKALEGRKLSAIFATHHHNDHTGGIAELAAAYEGVEVYSFKHSGRRFQVGPFDVKVIGTPAHTSDSVCFLIDDTDLFTGDTLFSAGCGRSFEGTPQQLYQSLLQLKELPKHIQVWPGHEYTANNLRFACSVMPGDQACADALQGSIQKQCTVPSTIGNELAINLFLRCDEEAVQKAMGCVDPVGTFVGLRGRKDAF